MGGGKVIHEGYLTKSPPTDGNGKPSFIKGWKRRYFRLYESLILEYSEKQSSDVIKGSVNVIDCTGMTESYDDDAALFSISTDKRTYYLRALDTRERQTWVNVLSSAGSFVPDKLASTPANAETEDSSPPKASDASPPKTGGLLRRLTSRRKRQSSSSSSTATLVRQQSSSADVTATSDSGGAGARDDSDVAEMMLRAMDDGLWPRSETFSSQESATAGTGRHSTLDQSGSGEDGMLVAPPPDLAQRMANCNLDNNVPLLAGPRHAQSSPIGMTSSERTHQILQNAKMGSVSVPLNTAYGVVRGEECEAPGTDVYTQVPSNTPLAQRSMNVDRPRSQSLESDRYPGYEMVPCNRPVSTSVDNPPAFAAACRASHPSTHSDSYDRLAPSDQETAKVQQWTAVAAGDSNPGQVASAIPPAGKECVAVDDSGISSVMFSRSGSSSSSAFRTPSPPKKTPPCIPKRQSADEGVIMESESDVTTMPEIGGRVAVQGRAMHAATQPIQIPSQVDGRVSMAPRESDDSPAPSSSAGDPAVHRSSSSVGSSTMCAPSRSNNLASCLASTAAWQESLVSPALPEKPRFHFRSPGQPLETEGYAQMTRDSEQVDRSTKPMCPASPDSDTALTSDAFEVDRSTKPLQYMSTSSANAQSFGFEVDRSSKPTPVRPSDAAALMTQGDFHVDRSTKPTRLASSDPGAPAIDRSSKPRAPINATLPQRNEFTTLMTTSPAGHMQRGQVIPPGEMIQGFDQHGNVHFYMRVAGPLPGVDHCHPEMNYDQPPPPIARSIGHPDQPYSVPTPARVAALNRSVSVGNAGGYAAGAECYQVPPSSRRISSSSSVSGCSSSMSGHQQPIPPGNLVAFAMGGNPYHSGMSAGSHASAGTFEKTPSNWQASTAHRSMSCSSRSSIGSFEQVPGNHQFIGHAPAMQQGAGMHHLSRASYGSVGSAGSGQRQSVPINNDGGDYILLPVHEQQQQEVRRSHRSSDGDDLSQDEEGYQFMSPK